MENTVGDIISAIEELAPINFAEDWDNIGLQLGDTEWPVRSVLIALDPLPDVVSDACNNNVDLLVTHHPLIFHPIKCIDVSTAQGRIIQLALKNQTAIYAAHTNLDAAEDGINDMLASQIGFDIIRRWSQNDTETGKGFGRSCRLKEPMTLLSLTNKIKQALGIEFIRIVGDKNAMVQKAAVCSGSGAHMLEAFFSSDADVFISGDLKYHDARAFESIGKSLIDIGHFASEHLMVELFSKRLSERLCQKDIVVKVEAYKLEKDPFVTI